MALRTSHPSGYVSVLIANVLTVQYRYEHLSIICLGIVIKSLSNRLCAQSVELLLPEPASWCGRTILWYSCTTRIRDCLLRHRLLRWLVQMAHDTAQTIRSKYKVMPRPCFHRGQESTHEILKQRSCYQPYSEIFEGLIPRWVRYSQPEFTQLALEAKDTSMIRQENYIQRRHYFRNSHSEDRPSFCFTFVLTVRSSSPVSEWNTSFLMLNIRNEIPSIETFMSTAWINASSDDWSLALSDGDYILAEDFEIEERDLLSWHTNLDAYRSWRTCGNRECLSRHFPSVPKHFGR